jgi:hypothetical protein
LREESETVKPLVFFTISLGVHFLVNDFGLREHHRTPTTGLAAG